MCTIPTLKDGEGKWHTEAGDKAALLAEAFHKKNKLPEVEKNEFSQLRAPATVGEEVPTRREVVNEDTAEKLLGELDPYSASGPDGLSTRVLKRCAKALARPVSMLANRILETGRWPEGWVQHWVVPLHKKKETFLCQNYRGVHLTAQLSKVMERLLGTLWLDAANSDAQVGDNQFAYRKKRGGRDLLAYASLKWLWAMRMKQKVAIYLSDVSGAFDKVEAERLFAKLTAKNIPPKTLAVLRSWLRERRATVVVGGQGSDLPWLRDQVFQGTVWGPILWSLFYEDSREAVQKNGFEELVFADDLNAFKVFDYDVKQDSVEGEVNECQKNLHRWGKANRVTFDPGKEQRAVLSRWPGHGSGDPFVLLGTVFDSMMTMAPAVEEIVKKVRWRKHVLLRSRRYHTTDHMVHLWKARVLGSIEHHTAAIYHASDTVLAQLDRIQTSYLEALGISEEEALLEHNLAPLAMRRDIAMLGLIHRTTLGQGPSHFEEFFKPATVPLPADHEASKAGLPLHDRQVASFRQPLGLDFSFTSGRCAPPDFFLKSAFGLIDVYNLLPPAVVTEGSTVQRFQGALQGMARQAACEKSGQWRSLFTPRWELRYHPLLRLRT